MIQTQSDPEIIAAILAEADSSTHTTPKSLLMDFSKMDWVAGVAYEFLPGHELRADISKTTYTDNGSTVYWSGDEHLNSEETVTNVSSSSGRSYEFNQVSSSLSRDDFVGMVTYTYKF